ncbi:hypothetical protein ABTZ59_11440 [Streptomyces sp. NPDC094034]|uniref:hypothetical protein n=1 Tax=Streptomyces sp. NPDC094034 TaxID=3155309 RepID=UPI00332E23BC
MTLRKTAGPSVRTPDPPGVDVTLRLSLGTRLTNSRRGNDTQSVHIDLPHPLAEAKR